jgi:cell division protein FtsN
VSSFQDKSDAEAYLAQLKASGQSGAYVTEAEVDGKTFYRVRLGNYRSLDAANDAKADFEKSAKKTASVMKL